MLIFFLFVIILIVFILISSIGIEIKNFNISNCYKIENKMGLFFQIYVLKKIKILSFKTNISKIKDVYTKDQYNIKKINKTIKLIGIKKNIIDKFKFKKLNLDINIGVGDTILTAYLIAILSTIFSIYLSKYIEGKVQENNFQITPIYNEKVQYKISLNCIISIKMVHIIYIIYLIMKKRRDEKYVRTSNRRTYESGYE